jgi:NSS family neurotransmitter:Na+ symporter
MAAVGGAVGLGNIWKFPYLTGTNGGGAFVVVYLVAVFAIAAPILIGELLLGRRGAQSPPRAMAVNASREGRSAAWSAVGWLGALTGFLILTFYSVIGGWVIDYAIASLGGFQRTTTEQSAARFQALLDSPLRMLIAHTAFLALTTYIIARGLRRGIERVTSVLMPMLFIMLMGLVGYAAVAGDLSAALRFMFGADFSKVTPSVVLTAIGQAFFSIGVSMGLMMAYGSYLARDVSVGGISVAICIADTLVAILAGLAIFPIVFGFGLEPGEGTGLIFITLPIAFGGMPGGTFVGGVFFLLLLIAALTSAIAILEPMVSWAEENRRLSRRQSALLLGGLAWLLGIGSVLSFNIWEEVRLTVFFEPLAELSIFELVDYLTANLFMPVGGILIALFVGWRMRDESLLAELGWSQGALFLTFRWLMRTLIPLAIGVMLVQGL